MEGLPSSRAKAKRLGSKRYFTGKACKHGHVDYRTTLDGGCRSCSNATRKRAYAADPEKYCRKAKEYAAKNPEKIKERDARRYNENRESEIARRRAHRLANHESQKQKRRDRYKTDIEKERKWSKAWKADNKDRLAFLQRTRHARKLERCPAWLTREDHEDMAKFYVEAKRVTAATGVKHAVDHIVPLQGEKVSGLHVPWNMQVLTSTDNLIKHNNFTVQ